MPKTIDSDGVVYYDRAVINQIYGQGFHFINDLVPLYHMLSYFKKYDNLSKSAKLRLKWMDYCKNCQNVSLTCRHFGISRKTFYKWQKKYDPNNLHSLEDECRAPIKRRQREITPEQNLRIIRLRKKYLKYSKIKLAKIYLREYEESISSWKIQKVIEKYRLYHNPRKTAKITYKRLTAIKKKRITELRKYFNSACQKLKLVRYYNRPRTPKDNPVNERFNKTLKDEFINLGNFTTDVVSFNQNLTDWLIEYNFRRPHQSLNYETPIKFNNSIKVSPMCPSSTS